MDENRHGKESHCTISCEICIKTSEVHVSLLQMSVDLKSTGRAKAARRTFSGCGPLMPVAIMPAPIATSPATVPMVMSPWAITAALRRLPGAIKLRELRLWAFHRARAGLLRS